VLLAKHRGQAFSLMILSALNCLKIEWSRILIEIWPAPHAILWIYIDWLRKWC
jgi:hypothetical protein